MAHPAHLAGRGPGRAAAAPEAGRRTRDWLRLEKDPGELYRGARLELALDWAEHNAAALSLDEVDFLDAARDARSAEAQREQAYRPQDCCAAWCPGPGASLIGILAILFFSTGLNNRFKTPPK